MAVLGTLLVLLIGLLGRRIGGDRVGLVAALIAALYPNLWVNDGLIMSETVTGIVVVLALLLAYNLRDRPRTATALGCGALCGLAALARAELGLLVPLLAVPAAWTARAMTRRDASALAAATVAAAVLVVAPWVLYNESRFKDTTFVSTNDGLTLAGANCARVYSGNTIGLWVIQPPCIDDPQPPGDQSQVSAAYRHKAFDYMRAQEPAADRGRGPHRSHVEPVPPSRHALLQRRRGQGTVGDGARPHHLLPARAARARRRMDPRSTPAGSVVAAARARGRGDGRVSR